MARTYSSTPEPRFVTKALLSAGGKNLDDALIKLAKVYVFKGSVATVDDLPSTYGKNEVGFVYNVLDSGMNYAWTFDEATQIGEWDALGSIVAGGGMIEITYAELKALRDADELVPGTFYRITDYQCTTTQVDTQSAGHQFDIIVMADDEGTLNENVKICQHEGDTYFVHNHLESWEAKYCIDNDVTRFSWADTVNGKGVIYWMKDEFNNECPYDFKNIQFKRFKVQGDDSKYKPQFYPEYSGFHGSMLGLKIINESDFIWCYTFSKIKIIWDEEEEYSTPDYSHIYDQSLNDNLNYALQQDGGGYTHPTFYCERNIISINRAFAVIDEEEHIENAPQILNNIVLLSQGKYFNGYEFAGNQDNIFESNCYNITLSETSSNNKFSLGCNNIILYELCANNNFSSSCSKIFLGTGSSENIFGSSCRKISLKLACKNNTFGSYNPNESSEGASDITLYTSNNNIFYDGVRHCELDMGCNNCVFYNRSHDITIKGAVSCIFQNYCYNITFTGTEFRNITFTSSCRDITITTSYFANANVNNIRDVELYNNSLMSSLTEIFKTYEKDAAGNTIMTYHSDGLTLAGFKWNSTSKTWSALS